MEPMDSQDMELLLQELLLQQDGSYGFESINTFDEAGVLTSDHGLVVRLLNGTKFQVTIKMAGR